MKRVILSLSIFLAVSVNGAACYAQEPVDPKVDASSPVVTATIDPVDLKEEDEVVPDGRAAAFLPPLQLMPEKPVVEDSSATTLIPEAGKAEGPAPEALETVDLGAPVSSSPLGSIDPESKGLRDGGFEPSLWRGTSYDLVTRLLPSLALPTDSAVMNDLARRVLITAAAVPDGAPEEAAVKDGERKPASLTALRVEKLLALGAVEEAWKLASLVGFEKLDVISLRLLVEAALVSNVRKDVCEKIPDMMEVRGKDNGASSDWEKSLIICKLQMKDQPAVQLGLDLLREQKVTEDNFMTLLSRNVLGRSVVLPRRLTPLRAIDVAVLHEMELPLPSELYARAEASLVPALLQTKPESKKDFVAMAELAGSKGLLTTSQLVSFYKGLSDNPQESSEVKGELFRARQIKAALMETDHLKKVDLAKQIMTDLPRALSTGSNVQLLGHLLADIPVSADYNPIAALGARLLALAGDREKGFAWYKLTLDVKGRLPEVQAQFLEYWPLYVLSGFVPPAEVKETLPLWVDHVLSASRDAQSEEDKREKKARLASILLLFDALGLQVPDGQWDKLVEAQPFSREKLPPLLYRQRMRMAAAANQKGETLLLTLLSSGDIAHAPTTLVLDIVRTLYTLGLKAEASAFAREAYMRMDLP